MLAAILQALFNFMTKLGVIFGLTFMVACTLFVVYCIIHGDIKINVIRSKVKKEKK